MPGLSETLAQLASRKTALASLKQRQTARRLSPYESFGSNPGSLQMHYYVPAQLPINAPLVVVLHGCTQTSEAYDEGSGWSQLADQLGFALLFPEQQAGNNPNLCFNWFLHDDTRRHAGEALSISQMIETMTLLHRIDRQRIFITGLSAGGAMTSVMLATYPEVFAGGAIIAGLPYGIARTVSEAFEGMRGQTAFTPSRLQHLLRNASRHEGPWPKLSIWHGASDTIVAPGNAGQIAAQWQGVHNLRKTPTRVSHVQSHARHQWTNAAGVDVLEMHIISKMGHGTPLKSRGADGLGSPGPFMLDVGVSSTRLISEFWGIAPPSAVFSTELQNAEQQLPRQNFSPNVSPSAFDHLTPLQGSTSPPNGIQSIIEEALRKAGLMR